MLEYIFNLLFNDLSLGWCTKWEKDCQIMRVCCQKPSPYPQGISLFSLFESYYLVDKVRVLCIAKCLLCGCHRLLSVLKRCVTRTFDPGRWSSSMLSLRLTTTCFSIARIICKAFYYQMHKNIYIFGSFLNFLTNNTCVFFFPLILRAYFAMSLLNVVTELLVNSKLEAPTILGCQTLTRFIYSQVKS